jgi:hypothetical protein
LELLHGEKSQGVPHQDGHANIISVADNWLPESSVSQDEGR